MRSMRSPEIARSFAAVTAAVTLGAGFTACGGDQVKLTLVAYGAPSDNLGELSEAVVSTDLDLQRLDASDWNCGGKLRPEAMTTANYNTSYAINYMNDNPDLGRGLISFYDQAFGENAMNTLLSAGLINGDTPQNQVVEGQDRITALMHRKNAATLSAARIYANFSCTTDGEVNIHRASNRPTVALPAGETVQGVVMDEAGISKFLAEVNKQPDGSPVADVITLGETEDGQPRYMVVVGLHGCDNPVLRISARHNPADPDKPERVVFIPTPGQPTPPPHSPEQPVGGVTPKRDTNRTPAGVPGHNGGSGTNLPTTGAGVGPAGQAPNAEGYVPGETEPAKPVEVVTSTDGDSNTGAADPGDAVISPDQGGTDAPEAPVEGIDPDVDKGKTGGDSV